MGISKTNLGVSVESILKFITGKIPSSHNVIIGRDSNDAHPISAITGLQTEVDKVNSISVAQKTVNQKHPQCLASVVDGQSFTPVTNLALPFIPTANSGIDYDETAKTYKLKANITYNIEALVRLISYQGYMYYSLYDYTNSKVVGKAGVCEASVGVNQAIIPSFSVITPKTDINVGIRVTVVGGTQTGAKLQNTSYMKIQEMERTIIDPVEYVNSDKGIEDTPVGNILSFMGTIPPAHYITCNGAIYNITEYPYLAQHIKDQFGSFNFFGGDGVTTFAVPDLRDEFLRGYHGNRTVKLSGEIGVHQDATQHINFLVDSDSHMFLNGEYGVARTLAATNVDDFIKSSNARGWTNNGSLTNWSAVGGSTKYTSRPTNTAVLYCIKYEPTYFMSIQGLIERTQLWEGHVGTLSTVKTFNSISLNNSIMNYDMIEFQYTGSFSDGGRRPQRREFLPEQIKTVIDTASSLTSISLTWGYGNFSDFTDILYNSTMTQLSLGQSQSYLDKVVGIKYKTFQN